MTTPLNAADTPLDPMDGAKRPVDVVRSAGLLLGSPEFQKQYGIRAGIEGTLSQGIFVCGMRRSRYLGEAKTHLQNVVIATALNLLRIGAWLLEVPMAKTRPSRFAVLASQWVKMTVPIPA